MSIKIDNLHYVYMKGSPFEKKALNGISLEIGDGELVGIIGHTGSGKTTLVQHFNGLLKPASGTVEVNGINVSGKGLKELRKHVGIVFQYPEHQFFEETVFKDIAFGLKKQIPGITEMELSVKVHTVIETVGLSVNILEKSPFELSGGQKRRVAIAEALVLNPQILILDEPAAGLDPEGRDSILGFIKELHNCNNMTIIIVSHYMEDIAKLANRLIVMNQGRIEMDGRPAEIFSNAGRLEQIGLSTPQISQLLQKLHTKIPQIDSSIYTIREAGNMLLGFLAEKRTC